MKNQNKLIVKIQLLLLLAICVTGPYLYAQCMTQGNCNFNQGGDYFVCYGSSSGVFTPVEGDSPRDLQGSAACGHVYEDGDDTGEDCGYVSSGHCA